MGATIGRISPDPHAPSVCPGPAFSSSFLWDRDPRDQDCRERKQYGRGACLSIAGVQCLWRGDAEWQKARGRGAIHFLVWPLPS